MAKEPEDLTLRMLRDIRATQTTHGKVLDAIAKDLVKQGLQLESLDERFEILREGTVSAVGYAAHADRQYRSVKDHLADLSKRVEKLEKAK